MGALPTKKKVVCLINFAQRLLGCDLRVVDSRRVCSALILGGGNIFVLSPRGISYILFSEGQYGGTKGYLVNTGIIDEH